MCECTAFFLSYTCVYACITLSRGRALSGFTCSCRVLHFVLCTTCMKPKAKGAPNSLCLCYRSGATFSFWCNSSAGRAEVQGGQSKGGGTGSFGPAQRPVCSLGVQLCTVQCRWGTQTLFGGWCAQCWFIVLTVSFHSSVIQNIFGECNYFYWSSMLTPFCRLFCLFFWGFLHSK